MSLLMDMNLKDFNILLASNAPAPGGGSAAALSGVLGSALAMMVVNLTIGKKSYENLDNNIKRKIEKDYEVIWALNGELTKLVDEDSHAFNLVMEAFKLPKETEEEMKTRAESIELASLYALKIPLTVVEKCLLILKHQVNIALYWNKNAISDIGVAALLSFAALQGAALNVKINLPGITDRSVKADTLEKVHEYLNEGEKLNNQIAAIVKSRIEE